MSVTPQKRSVLLSISKTVNTHRRMHSALIVNHSNKKRNTQQERSSSKTRIILNIPYRTNRKHIILYSSNQKPQQYKNNNYSPVPLIKDKMVLPQTNPLTIFRHQYSKSTRQAPKQYFSQIEDIILNKAH